MKKKYYLSSAWCSRNSFKKMCDGIFNSCVLEIKNRIADAIKDYNFIKKKHPYANRGDILYLELVKIIYGEDDEEIDKEYIKIGYYYCFSDKQLRPITPNEIDRKCIDLND